MRALAFVAVAVIASAAIWLVYGEFFLSFAAGALAYGRVWLLLALKKLGWPVIWKFLQPLLIRLAAWELPKRSLLWGLTLVLGVRNRRALQGRIRRAKGRARGLARAQYGRLEARFGRYTRVVVGGVLVLVSILVSVLILGVYVFWYSATFFRALLTFGGWGLRLGLVRMKIGVFNAIALSPFRWLPRLLPPAQAARLQRFNLRIARQIIRRGRTTLPQLDRREFSFRQVLLMIWLPVRYGVRALLGRDPDGPPGPRGRRR